MFKKSTILEIVVVVILAALFVFACVHFHIGILGALLVLFIGLIGGAQTASHFENALDYNLEDIELDELNLLHAKANVFGKAAINKLKAAGSELQRIEARAKVLEEKLLKEL